ncbi:MAG: hypothetical protein OEM41_08095, partial [Ignavibacteria bacterium]|nr:hypothetical protein [Ignavibacteria bacterium]
MSAVEDPVLPANPSPDESLQRSAVATRVEFSPGEAGTYVGLLPDADPGSYTLMVIFDAASYPFNHHCRFIRHREPALPYTFANMEFGDSPPGLR